MMLEKKTTEFLNVLSSSAPVPGGGGASAAVGAFGAALGMMVANLTVGKKKYADVEAEMIEICGRLEKIRDRLIVLTDEDAKAFEPLSKAYGLTPMEIMKTVLDSMKLLEILGEKGSRIAISDVGVGILFAQAALEGASLNVFINTGLMKNAERACELNETANRLIAEGQAYKERIYAGVCVQLKS